MTKYQSIYNKYRELYFEKYRIYPIINYPQCGKLLKSICIDHEEKDICAVLEMYFATEPVVQAFHLPSILSAYNLNRYLPKIHEKVEEKFLND